LLLSGHETNKKIAVRVGKEHMYIKRLVQTNLPPFYDFVNWNS